MSRYQEVKSMQKVSVPTVVAIAMTCLGFGAMYEYGMALNGPVSASIVGWIGVGLTYVGLAGVLFFGIKAERKRNAEAAASH